jgi:hypothetical protein
MSGNDTEECRVSAVALSLGAEEPPAQLLPPEEAGALSDAGVSGPRPRPLEVPSWHCRRRL